MLRRVLPLALAIVAGWVVTAIGVGEVEPLRPRPDLTAMRVAGPLIAFAASIALSIVVGRRFRVKEGEGHAPRWLPLIAMCFFFTALPLISVAFENRWSVAFDSVTTHALAFGGVFLIYSGVKRRVGTSRHCPGCDYEYNFNPDDGPPRCPECGERWTGRLVVGVVERSAPRIVAGSLVLLLPFVMLFVPWGAVLPMGSVPTAALVAHIRVFGLSLLVYNELEVRTLSPAEINEVAAVLVEARRADGYRSSLANTWLSKAPVATRLSPEIKGQLQAFDADVRLSIPWSGVVGEAFPVLLYKPGATRPLFFDRIDVVELLVDGEKMPLIVKQIDYWGLDPTRLANGFKRRFADGIAKRSGRVEVSVVISLQPPHYGTAAADPPRRVRLTREIDILPK